MFIGSEFLKINPLIWAYLKIRKIKNFFFKLKLFFRSRENDSYDDGNLSKIFQIP